MSTEAIPLLDGVRVVDLTDDYGAFAARLLAELGAEVVRVEAPDGGRGATRAPRTDAGTSLHHLHRNAGKQIVRLDLAAARAPAPVDDLLAGADLAFVSRGQGADGDPFDAAALSARHPHLVVVSITPFGRVGTTASWASTELVDQALAGVVYRSGVAELPPVAAPGSYCEDVGAVLASVLALVGLHARDARGGAGELLDVSTVAALAQCTDMAVPLWSILRADQTRNGAGLYPLFPCTDGLARIVLPMTPGDWRALIAWLGSPPEWTGPEWEGSMLAAPEREQILAALPAMFATRTREAVTVDAEAAGIRVTPVLSPAEVLANEHVVDRVTFRPVVVDGRDGGMFAGLFGVRGTRAEVASARVLASAPRWPARPKPAASPNVGDGSLPLMGVRVLEIGTGVAAPEAGRVLGEWGAEVIKVETRGRPDFQRRVFGTDMNPAFATVARNKLAFGANLGHPDGRALVHDLLAHVDLVVENNATGVLGRLGFGWDVLAERHPHVSLVSSQLYGDRGPWAMRKGYGPSARAVGGLAWLWAHDVDAPRGVQTIHPDHLAGRLVALGGLAALRHRSRTGRGTRVDVAQFEAVMALLGDLLMAESLVPGAAAPLGNRSADHAPWGLYRAADDAAGAESWVAICVTDDAQWRALVMCAAGALPDDDSLRGEAGRVASRARVDDALATWVRTSDAEALEAQLQAHGVPAGRALHPRLQATHPLFVAHEFLVPVEQPGIGPIVLEGTAARGARIGRPRCGPAPLPGEHTRDICRRLLGLDDAAIDDLVARGALEVG